MSDETNATGGQVSVNAAIDTLQSSGSGQTFVSGTVAQRLLHSNFNVDVLRPCAAQDDLRETQDGLLSVNAGTLLRDEWVLFDRTVQNVARERLTCVADVISRGLTYPIPNALGVMNIEWERIKGEMANAEVTMSGLTRATASRQETEIVTMPIPIFHTEFYLNLRHLAAARRNGRQLDMSHAEVATRKVAELIEDTYFNGLTIANMPIYGIKNEPNRKTMSVTQTWLTASGEQIVADIIAMIDKASSAPNNFEGPYTLYVPRTVGSRFGNDYKANSDKTILQRIMEIPGIEKVMWTSRLTGTTALLVQMTSDVVQMVDGMQPTMVEWESHGGFQHNFKVMAIMLPRVRSTGWSQSGIVQIS